MNNAALKAIIEEYGNQLFYISLGESLRIFLNVDAGDPEMTCTSDMVQFKTVSGTDFFGIPHPNHKAWGQKVPYTRWYVTDQIHSFATCDDPDSRYMPDIAAIR